MSRSRSLPQFQAEFPDEPACAEFLIRHRWPDGFVCPKCRGVRAVRLKSRAYTFECLDCGRQTSITSGTILHRTKLPLTAWFWAAHPIATHSNGISALQLANQIGVNDDTEGLPRCPRSAHPTYYMLIHCRTRVWCPDEPIPFAAPVPSGVS